MPNDVILVNAQGRPVISDHRVREMVLSVQSRDALSRARLAGLSGMMYGDSRDIWKAAGYKKKLEEDDFWDLYERNGLAGRIVDKPAKTTWKSAPKVVELNADGEDVPDTDSTFAQAANRWLSEIGAFPVFERADRLARVFEYSVVLIGSTRSQGQLDRPLAQDALRAPEDVGFLMPYRQSAAEVSALVDDVTDPRFGEPAMYRVKMFTGGSRDRRRRIARGGLSRLEVATGRVPVHGSRIIHIAEDRLEDKIHGRPALMRAFNTLQDILKVVASSSESWWRNVSGFIHANLEREARLPEKDAQGNDPMDELRDKILDAVHGIERFVGTQGLDRLEIVGGDHPNPKGMWDVLKEILSTAADMPSRVIFGSERGELASQLDERNWLGSIEERQEKHGGPTFVRALVDRMIDVGALERPAGYRLEWESLNQLSEKDEAEVVDKKASAANRFADAQLKGLRVTDGEVRGLLGLSEEVPEEIEDEPTDPEEAEAQARRDMAELLALATAGELEGNGDAPWGDWSRS